MVEFSHAFNDYFALARPRRFQKPARFFNDKFFNFILKQGYV